MSLISDPRFISVIPSSLTFTGVPHSTDVIEDFSLTQVSPIGQIGQFNYLTGADKITFELTSTTGSWVDFSQSFISYRSTITASDNTQVVYMSSGAASPFSRLSIRTSGSTALLEDIADFNSVESVLHTCMDGMEDIYSHGAISQNLSSNVWQYDYNRGTGNTLPNVNKVNECYLYPRSSGILKSRKLMPIWVVGSLFIDLYLDNPNNVAVVGGAATIESQIIDNVFFNLHTVKTSSVYTASFSKMVNELDAEGRGGVLIPFSSCITQRLGVGVSTEQTFDVSSLAVRLKSLLAVVRRTGDRSNQHADYQKCYLYGLSTTAIDAAAVTSANSFPYEFYSTIGGEQFPSGRAITINRTTGANWAADALYTVQSRAMGYLEQAVSMFGKPLQYGFHLNPKTYMNIYAPANDTTLVVADQTSIATPIGFPNTTTKFPPLFYPDPIALSNAFDGAADATMTTSTNKSVRAMVPKTVYGLNYEKDSMATWLSGLDIGSGGNILKFHMRFNQAMVGGYDITFIMLIDRVMSIGSAGQVNLV